MNMNCILSSPKSVSAVPASGPRCSTIDSLLNTSSAVDLPPIQDITNNLHKSNAENDNPPEFLEPIPLLENYRCESTFVPRIYSTISLKELPSLVPSSASSCSSESSNPPSPQSTILNNTSPYYRTLSASSNAAYSSNNATPPPQIPCRHACLPSIQPKPEIDEQRPSSFSRCPVAHNAMSNWTRNSNNVMVDASGLPLSPTMVAASVAASAASIQHHSGSIVADTFLNSLSLSSSEEQKENEKFTEQDDKAAAIAAAAAAVAAKNISCDQQQASFARVSFMVHGTKRPSLMGSSASDQRMFLTKNAHIKRPRNAWIHFRCHYGQALKSQDPTLRAEEISKRASRRWARLSENEKKPWHDLAEQEKQAHKEAFPDYRYCPRRSNSAAIIASQSVAAGDKQRMKSNSSLYSKFDLTEEIHRDMMMESALEKRAKRRLMK